MQHEALVREPFQTVDHLLGILGAQRGGADGLRLTAREQGRPVGAGQEVHHRLDRTDLGGLAAIDTAAVLQDGTAHDVGFQLLDHLAGGHLLLAIGLGEMRLRLVARAVEGVRTFGLVGQLVGCRNVVADDAAQLFLDRVVTVGALDFPRLLGGLFSQIDDRVDHRLDVVVREHDRAQHDVLVQFLGFGLHHHHGVAGGGNDQVKLARFLDVGQAGVQDIFAVLIADARAADRAHEGQTGNGQRSRCRDHCKNIRLGLAIIGQDLADHVDFVVKTFGEQRAHRTVDETAGQRLLFRGAAFALEEATRNAPGGREFFLIVNGEREEILPFAHALGGGHGAQHHGIAIGCEHGAISLTGDAAGFQSEGLAAPFQLYFLRIEHIFSF